MAAPEPPPYTPPRSPDQFPVSGPWSLPRLLVRVGARLLDMVIFGIPMAAIAIPFIDLGAERADMFDDLPLWAVIAAAFVPFVYDFVSVAMFGRTIGKLAFGMKVVRYLVGLGFPLGGLLNFWEPIVYSSTAYSPIRRGLHDRAAGTIVVAA